MKKPEPAPATKLELNEANQFWELFTNYELIDKLAVIDKKYPYWDKFKQQVKGFGFDPVLLWKFNSIHRNKAVIKINICEHPGFKFKYNTTAEILRFLHEFDLNLGGKLDGSSTIPNEDKDRFLISSIMEEAIASSQLEGAVSTREAAKEMLRSQRKPRNHSEKMILNNYLTIKKIHEIKDQPFSKELILQIHSIIAKDALENGGKESEGAWRNNNNINIIDNETGEIAYTPPDHEKIEELMSWFCEFANRKQDAEFIHPIIRAIILHFLIGYIHPFSDGNGRTARAVFYWYMLRRGYWLVEYLSISRIIVKSPVKYAKAYLHTEFDNNDLTYFIYYNLRALNLAVEDLQKYINKKIEEKKNSYALISNEDVNDRQTQILQEFIYDDQKMLSIKEVENKFGVAYQTARTDLLKLVQLGYLEDKLRGKKTLFFKSPGFDGKLKGLH